MWCRAVRRHWAGPGAAAGLCPARWQRAVPDTAAALQFHVTVLPTSVLGAQTWQTSLTCHGTAWAGVCNTSCKATEQDGKNWGWNGYCERQASQQLGHAYGFPYFTTMLTLCATLQLCPDLKWDLDGNSSLLPFLLPLSRYTSFLSSEGWKEALLHLKGYPNGKDREMKAAGVCRHPKIRILGCSTDGMCPAGIQSLASSTPKSYSTGASRRSKRKMFGYP